MQVKSFITLIDKIAGEVQSIESLDTNRFIGLRKFLDSIESRRYDVTQVEDRVFRLVMDYCDMVNHRIPGWHLPTFHTKGEVIDSLQRITHVGYIRTGKKSRLSQLIETPELKEVVLVLEDINCVDTPRRKRTGILVSTDTLHEGEYPSPS